MSGNGTLASALLAAQKAMPAIHKDSKADTGKFKYTYLSLQGLLEVVLPVLNDNDLALSQVPVFDNGGKQVLRTTLIHGSSGEQWNSWTPLILSGNETPQTWGGAVTYARRYALTALLGIAADEDDDAAAASKPRNTTARTAAATREDAPAPAAGAGASSPDKLAAADQGIQALADATGKTPEAIKDELVASYGDDWRENPLSLDIVLASLRRQWREATEKASAA